MSVERSLPLVRERKEAILAGDAALIAEQKKAGKLTARERIAALLDEASFVELDVLNADAGVVAGYGTVDGNPVYVYAQDFTVGGGAVGQKHARKVLKVMELAQKTGCPIVAMLDSAGAKLDEGVAALDAYAMIAAKASALSGVVPQIALVMGACGGTAAAIAEISDFAIQSAKGQLFVNGPLVVSAVSGKKVDMEEIAGCEASEKHGAVVFSAEDDKAAVEKAVLRAYCIRSSLRGLMQVAWMCPVRIQRIFGQARMKAQVSSVASSGFCWIQRSFGYLISSSSGEPQRYPQGCLRTSMIKRWSSGVYSGVCRRRMTGWPFAHSFLRKSYCAFSNR